MVGRITELPDQTFTVAELNRQVRSLLEDRYAGIWVEAEVTEATRARSGHLYFALADVGGGALINAVMWQGQAMRYGSRIQVGLAARCHGRLTLYEARGSYQLVVDRVEEAGAGIKAKKLALLRQKLEAEGLFLAAHKKPLPRFPSCIGVVTSRSGAAIRDIVKILTRRFPVRLILAHAQVQGTAAPAEITAALRALAAIEAVDLVIIGRGGGSAEDLDAFNTEDVVRAVFAHPQPVISAVGHETDVTLVDLVADRRAATPSEAAEMAVPDRGVLLDALSDLRRRIASAVQWNIGIFQGKLSEQRSALVACDPRMRLSRNTEQLAALRGALLRWPDWTLPRARQAITALFEPIFRWQRPALAQAHAELAFAFEPIFHWQKPALAQARGDLWRLSAELDALSPLASLDRGYAIVKRRFDGAILRSFTEAPVGTELDIILAQGELGCIVQDAKKEKKQRC